MKVSVISFTKKGIDLSLRLKEVLEAAEETTLFSMYSGETGPGIIRPENTLSEWAGKQMQSSDALIFIGAMGICVRAIAESVKNKLTDPAVINIDETGRFVIPVLSGHVGGANELAERIASVLSAVPVLTTATDLENAFAVDSFAKENGFGIRNRSGIAGVSSKSLDGKAIRLQIENFPSAKGDCDVLISNNHSLFGTAGLVLCPRKYAIGIGCRKGKSAEEIRAFLEQILESSSIDPAEIGSFASIDLKKDEPGLIELSRQLGMPFITFPAEMLRKAEGDFTASEFVEEKTGVDNVCERAAMLLCNNHGRIIVPKTVNNGITAAIAECLF